MIFARAYAARGPRRWHLALSIGLAVGSSRAEAADFDVYILTGQSNSLGTTSSSESLPDPGPDPADAATGFFWSNVSSSNTVYPPNLYGDSGAVITALQTQQGDEGANPTFWGPEFGFARTLANSGASDVLIIKASRGGGSNHLWDESTFVANDDDGHMWGHLRDTITAGLGQIGAGDTFQVEGLLYMQGESNTTVDAAIADVRLNDLVANVKAHVESAHPGTTDGLYTVVAEIAASQSTAERLTTTNLQRALAADSSAIGFVGTSDQPLKSDGIHFGGVEKLEIGHRFADAFNSRAWVEDPNRIAGYSANFGSIDAIPHPIAQGLAEGGRVAGVTMEAIDAAGTAAWRISDDSSISNPEYRQGLDANDFRALFESEWIFKARAKVVSGGGLALWSLSVDNDPGWGLSAPRNMNGFQLSRVNGDELAVTLWRSQQTFNLGVGSANDFHTLELRGAAGSNLFDFFIDGQLQSSGIDLRDGLGLAGFDDALIFNSGSTAGVGLEVDWNEVSLTAVPEPRESVLLGVGGLVGLLRCRARDLFARLGIQTP